MRATKIVLAVLFVVTHATASRLHRVLARRGAVQRRSAPFLVDYYDDSVGQDSFENSLHELERRLEDFEERDPVRREKAVTFDQPTLENKPPGIVLRLTDQLLEYAKQKLLAVMRADAVRARPARLEVPYLLGANLSVDALQIVEFETPRVAVQSEGGGVVRLRSEAGGTRLRGLYRSAFRTVRDGVLETSLRGFQLDLRLKFLKTFDGGLKLIDSACAFRAAEVLVALQPPLAAPFADKLKDEVIRRLKSSVCPSLQQSLTEMQDAVSSFASFRNPIHVASQFSKGVLFDSRLLTEPQIAARFTDFPLAGEFLSNRTATHGEAKPLKVLPTDVDRMMFVYVSDHSVNSFFEQLAAFGDVRLNLHVLPEIVDFLRPSCAKFEMCVGHFAALGDVSPETGRLVLKAREAPRVRFTSGAVHVHLKSTVEISYQTEDNLLSGDSAFVTFDADIALKITKLAVLKSADGQYAWTGKIHIDDISAGKAVAHRPQMRTFVENLQFILNKSKSYLEVLVSSHLRPSLPVRLAAGVDLSNFSVSLRPHSLVVGVDVDVDSRLLPHVSLFV